VVVGGTGARGVVAAASYEARRYGVRSAMSSAEARRRCPEVVFLPGDHQHYGDVSAVLHGVFDEFTHLVEPIALDEAFLDITGALRRGGSAIDVAWRLRARVAQQTGLTCSVGVARNKLLAKLASEAAKPRATPLGVEPGRAVVEVPLGSELAFLHPLPVGALWGVGPRTAERLERRQVRTVGELAGLRREDLIAMLGSAQGRHVWELAQAIDDRPVEAHRRAKSIGHEETFTHDLVTVEEVRAEVVRLADAVAARVRRAGVSARTVSLKVRRSDFSTLTRSATPSVPVDTGPAIMKALSRVLHGFDPGAGVRLVGVSCSNLVTAGVQLTLDMGTEAVAGSEPSEVAQHDAALAVDRVRDRFGDHAIGPASALNRREPPGNRPWGPLADGT
jgi:DNA polymerase-4